MADSDLPEGYEDYPDWSVSDVKSAVAECNDPGILDYLLSYEKNHKDRKTAKKEITRRLKQLDEQSEDDTSESESTEETDSATPEPGFVPEQAPPQEMNMEFRGGDNRNHILVKNPQSRGAHIGGLSFKPGEVKDVVANDKIRSLIRRGKLQYVSPA